MWRLLGLTGVFVLMMTPASAVCSGDCDGNGAVSIDELVSAVRIALAQAPLNACANADSSGDGRVTVDDLVRAVNAALRGCDPTPTATRTASHTVTASPTPSPSVGQPTGTPSAPASVTPSPDATVTPSGSPQPTNSATPSASTLPSDTPTMEMPVTATHTTAATEATPTPSATNGATETNVPTATPTASLTASATQPPSASPTRTPTATHSPTHTASPSVTAIATQTRTPTLSPSVTATPTGGPLGTRRFSLNPASSAFIGVLGPGMAVGGTGFMGYLDLEAGAPDSQTGYAVINVTGSSAYLQLKSGADLICIKPLVPADAVGIVDCDGGTNLGITIRQDHRIGVVGTDEFTAEDCASAGGAVEAGDLPHPQVCNGPLTVQAANSGDSGPGAVSIAPDQFGGVNGLPVQLTVEMGDECTGNGMGFTDVLPLISNNMRTEIAHANNGTDTLVYDNSGEGFSCPAWTQEDGPGQLILSFPTLHGAVGNADVINVFVFDD